MRRKRNDIAPSDLSAPATTPAGSLTPTDLALAAASFFLALLPRLWMKNPESIWLDEANSVLISQRSLSGIVQALRLDGNPPLYYVLLHFWMAAFGNGEATVRTFSVLLGSVLPPTIFLAAHRLSGRRAALICAVLTILWPVQIYYSQQVRMYALLPTLSVAFMMAFFSALRRETEIRPWVVMVVSAITLVYTHNYGMFVVLAAPLAWWIRGSRTKTSLLRLASSLGIVLAAYLPWLFVIAGQARTDVGSWIALSFRADAPLRSLLFFGPAVPLPLSAEGLSHLPPEWLPSALWLLVVLGGGGWLIRRQPAGQGLKTGGLAGEMRTGARETDRDIAGALLLFLAVPLLVPYLISWLGRPIYYVGRYEIVAYPAFVLLLGMSAARLLRPSPGKAGRLALPFALGLLVIYTVLAGVSLTRYRARKPDRTDDRIVTSLTRWVTEGDVVIISGLGRAPIEYYLEQRGWGDKLRLLSYPEATARHMGWYDFASARRAEPMEAEAERLVHGLSDFTGKVFLIDNNSFPELYRLQEPLRRKLLSQSKQHQTLLRTGPDPRATPISEVTVFTFGS